MTGLAVAACGKSDKSSETEAAEENAELQTIEFDTGAEEPVETAQIPEPVEEVPVVIEETPLPEEPEPAENTEEPLQTEEPAQTQEPSSSDYTVEDISEVTLYTTETVNMRNGPSASDFDVAEILSPGTQVTANGKVNGYKGDGKSWYRIKKSDGSSGFFIIADYLSDKKPEKKEETAETPAAETPAPVAAAPTPAPAAGGTHNLNGLIVNDVEYRALLDTWRWATNGTDEEAEHYVLKHSAGDLEAVLKSKGLR